MPYEWTQDPAGDAATHLALWPHRSLPRRGFAAFILGTFTLITIPLYPLLGTVVLWGLLPFLLLAVAGLWWGLEHSYKTARVREDLSIDSNHIHLVRTNPGGHLQEWDCNSYWARAHLHPTGGPVPYYITLKGRGREVEIGAFLSEAERKALYGELTQALRGVAGTE